MDAHMTYSPALSWDSQGGIRPSKVLRDLCCSMPTTTPYLHPCEHSAHHVTGGKEVVVSRKAAESMLRGAELYAPGVLACSANVSRGDLVAVSVALELPGSDWCGITRGTVLGSEHGQRSASGSPRSGLYIGTGRAEMSRNEMFRAESGLAVAMEARVFDLPPCEGLFLGEMMLQNLPSLVAAQVLAPQPGSRVLDMCAAPGGKTTTLAQLMGDRGTVIALDRSHAKVADIMSLCKELGITCVRAFKLDATQAVARPDPGAAPHLTAPAPGQPAMPLDAALDTAVQRPSGGDDPHATTASGGGGGGGVAASIGAPAPASGSSGSLAHAGLKSDGGVDGGQPGVAPGHPTDRCAPLHGGPSGSGTAGGAAGDGAGGCGGCSEGFMVWEAGQRGPSSAKELRRQERRAAAKRLRGHDVAQEPQHAQQPGATAADAGSKLVGFLPESFDHVLLDAPCSALGLRPRLLHRQTMSELRETACYQRRLMDAAVRLLRPGGTMVFSTCTFNPGENEGNVRWVLDTFPCLQLLEQSPRLGGPGLTGPACAHPSADVAAYRAEGSLQARSTQHVDAPTCGDSGTAATPAGSGGSSVVQVAPGAAAGVPPGAQKSVAGVGQVPVQAAGVHGGAQVQPANLEGEAPVTSVTAEGDGSAQAAVVSREEAPVRAAAVDGAEGLGAARTVRWLSPGEARLVQRFDPSQVDTIGFFIAKFVKTSPLA